MRLRVRHDLQGNVSRLAVGDSVAVDGVCLTVTNVDVAPKGGEFAVDLGPRTQERTTFGQAREGRKVHLEAALRAGEPLGGHFVSGHVDGIGEILDGSDAPDHRMLRIRVEQELGRFLVPRGSVCVDGVSLTITEVAEDTFSVMVVPHTRAVTRFGEYHRGDRVNIEVDLLARYLDRLLQEKKSQ